ncbi:aliphatic sulfonate ABC transporter substrate-binding protein [Paenibacillus sp. GSMTC-2017]|uniref:aliphatic sulfonate ABC transporter substrate-binding protein n=1 Tax=Paenibacillus sp. GSMTC-2017 TaxID=2794350 RepID=UPI0018D6CC11|nr:aliphatic sulfonate ABC transporter substrate-binding protein [Paenibacillus sp. GSMTC-2017]MBH5319129.1 aliphatic sulfonate ABC transporter substrate-binding protein [Paenibacillus sp. GSMTC-2017]
MSTKKENNLKHLFLIPLSLLLLVLLAGCANTESPKSQDRNPVTVNLAINGGTNLFTIIKEKGLLDEKFKALNATIIWSEFPSGPPLLESLAAGRVDISLLGDGAALQGQSAGLPFVNIGLLSDGAKLNSILVPTGSDIKTIGDLKGKKIALAKGTTYHVFLLKLLEKNGLKEKDLNIVNLQATDALPAFLSGQVDAWASGDPFKTQLSVQQKATVLAGDEQGVLAPVSLIARTDFAKKYPELVIEFLSVYEEALKWQNDNIDEVAKIHADARKIPVEIMKEVIINQKAELSPISDAAVSTQQASADILLETGFLKKGITYKEYVDNSFLEKLADK